MSDGDIGISTGSPGVAKDQGKATQRDLDTHEEVLREMARERDGVDTQTPEAIQPRDGA